MVALRRLVNIFTKLFLFSLLSGCQLCQCSDDLYVTYAPSYIQFMKEAGALPSTDIPKVIAQTLGFWKHADFRWKGLLQGSVFKRAKANVLVTVSGYTGMKSFPFQLDSVARYPVTGDMPYVDVDVLSRRLQHVFMDKDPLHVDMSVDATSVDVRTRYPDLFRRIPSTLQSVADHLMGFNSVMNTFDAGSLNISKMADLTLLGELQVIQDLLFILKTTPKLLSAKSPDLYTFTVSGLRNVVSKYGLKSTQTADAIKLVGKFLTKMTEEFRLLYKDNVVVEVLSLVPEESSLSRKTRSLKSTTDSSVIRKYNLADDYNEEFPAIFNIILWGMIFLAIATYAICYGMWNIDPGRDSIIYRMTAQRLKTD